MKKKKAALSKNFTVRGVSFPKQPNVIKIAEEAAKNQNRNFSNYIVELILKDSAREGANNG